MRRTGRSGDMINSVGGAGDKNRPPRTGSTEPVNGVVHMPELDGMGGLGDEDSPPGLDSMTRSTAWFVSTMLFVCPGRMARVAPVMRTASPGSNMPLHCGVRILPQGPGGPSVKDGDVSASTVANVPEDALAMSKGYREIVRDFGRNMCRR